MTQREISSAWLVVGLIGLSGCNSKPPAPPDPKAAFRGVTIKVLAPDQPQILTWLDDQRGEWSAQTGAQVEVVALSGTDPTSPQTGLAGSALAESNLPACDIVIFPSTGMANAVASGMATKVPPEVLDATAYEIRDIASAVADNLISWDRMTFALPLSVDTQLIYYRTDLFSHEEIQEDFQNKHGRRLVPPQTWDDFDQIVKFFDGTDLDGDGAPDHSLCIANVGRALVCRAAAYGKPPQNFSFYFDVTSMEPLADAPAFQLAMERWSEVAQCIANDRRDDPQLAAFTAGRAVIALGSSRLAQHLLQSTGKDGTGQIAGKVGCLSLPGSSRVYLHDRKNWSELRADKLNRAAIVDGLCAAVPRTSTHSAVAFDFLAFLTNRERSLSAVTLAANGFGPYRLSHLIDSAAWVSGGWPAASVPSYLSAMHESLNQPNAVAILRIDASTAFHQSLEAEASAAMRGEKLPADALAAVAETWRNICNERGKDRLRRQYRYSLGLPVLN
jgi:multiple sugar transport system substrate-binding protein